MNDKEIKVIGGKKSTLKMAETAIAKLPWLVNPLLQGMAAFLSPFDRHLRLEVLVWEDKLCELLIPKLRRLRDHQGLLHPSVANAAGERAAFFLLQRNFPFWQYSVELREVDCMFVKKLEGSATVRVELSAEDFTTIQAQLAGKQEANIKLRSEIQGVKQKVALAQVRTSWFIKKRSLLKDLWKS